MGLRPLVHLYKCTTSEFWLKNLSKGIREIHFHRQNVGSGALRREETNDTHVFPTCLARIFLHLFRTQKITPTSYEYILWDFGNKLFW